LNLRGEYKAKILDYIAEKYPQYKNEYDRIYKNKEMAYWQCLAAEIDEYCCDNNIKYINYFYHEKLVAEKKASGKNK
ncbi:MAG: radical SAM protein, partial [Oscillospiraceae bacterium]